MIRSEVVTAPAVEPITVAEAKSHLRVSTTADDAYILGLIRTVRESAEMLTGRAFITQTWKLYLDRFPQGREIELPRPPLQSVTHVKYTDTDDATSTFDAGDYQVDAISEPGRVVLDYQGSWPSATLRAALGVEIQYVAGYGDDIENVPARLIQGMLIWIAHLYENREPVLVGQTLAKVPMSVQHLLAFDRLVPV